MIVRILYTILLTGWAFSLGAQYRFENAVHLTREDGLPHHWVYDIEEDGEGFIWIGTYAGLCRYDGSNVLPVKGPAATMRVRSLLRTGDTLWISSFDGLAIMNLKTGQFEEIPVQATLGVNYEEKSIRGLYQDRQGYVWMAPDFLGLVRIDPATMEMEHFPMPVSGDIPAIHSTHERQSLVELIQDPHDDAVFWGVSFADLIRLNVNTGNVTRFRHELEDETLEYTLNNRRCLFAHEDKIYLGSWGAGLSVFDPATQQFFVPSLDAPEKWIPQLKKETLYCIFPANDKELYLTFASGLYLYNTTDQSVQCLEKNIFNPYVNRPFGVSFQDSAGRLWSYLSKNGVHLYDPLINQFDFFSLDELNHTDDLFLPRVVIEDFYPGYITVAGQYGDGLFHVNPRTGHSFKTPVPESHMAQHKYFHIWGIARLSPDELIISEPHGLYYFKKGMKELVPFSLQPKQAYASLAPLAIGSDRRLWCGSFRDGLWSIDLPSGIVQDHTADIGHTRVSGVYTDRKENIWFQFPEGHAVLPAGASEIKVFNYAADSLHTLKLMEDFCECPNGEIWVAANAEGIALLSPGNPEQGVLRKIPLADSTGTGTETAFRIACDRRNNLWVAGYQSLLRIDRNDGSISRYSYEYGLKRVEGAFTLLRSGKLFIGSREGFYLADPEQLRINTTAPDPYILSIRTNKGPRGTLLDYISRTPLRLAHNENALTIEFSAVNFTLPQAGRFEYRMEGVDEAWNDPGKNRTVTYSNLNGGGEYIFQLRAANNEGIWSGTAYELPIVINAAWYETPAFFLFLGLVLIGLVYGIYKYRVGEVRREEQLRSEFELKIANIEMSALRAQMNPHFIFNCLNSIDRYIIRNDTRKASEYLNSFGRLIRLILQNSRADYINLKDEIESLELYIKLEQMRARHSFDYEICVAPDLVPENYEVPPMLLQPFVENAIWHGLSPKKDRGKVKISISKGREVIRCVIEDDGIGREAAQAINDAKQVKRQSMGMHITSERMEIINKMYHTNNRVRIIDLHDEEGKARGTKVVLSIPL